MKNLHVELTAEGGWMEIYFQEESHEIFLSKKRPMVVVIPGGGYSFTSDREAEPVAMAFLAMGFHAAVVRYPVAPNRFPAALVCEAKAVAWIREHAPEYCVDADNITLIGFSAGGHLAASLGVYWHTPFLREQTGLSSAQMRPNYLILSYPVISAGEYAHRGSFTCLMGEKSTREQQMTQSLEYLVSADTPPCFIWTTDTDETVPPENALLFSMALRKYHIPQELHMYSEGVHGLSLCNYVTAGDFHFNEVYRSTGEDSDGVAKNQLMNPVPETWVELARKWLVRMIGNAEK